MCIAIKFAKKEMHVLQNEESFIFVDCLDFFVQGLENFVIYFLIRCLTFCVAFLLCHKSPSILTLDRDKLEKVHGIVNS